jgi:hypothetical protein
MAPRRIEGSGTTQAETVQLGPNMSADASPATDAAGLTPQEGDDSPRPVRVRVPFGGSEFKMTATAQPGYHLHWFNDRPGRIDRAKLAGYEHILDGKGQPISMVVDTQPGVGGGMLAYAMEIPIEFWTADLKVTQDKIKADEEVIRKGLLGHKEGDGRYVPPGAIRIRRG